MNYFELAKAYYDGDDEHNIKEDLSMCEYHLQKALEDDSGNPEIYYYFGLLYSENEDFEDFDKAIYNYKKSFNLGYKDSALNIALLYETSLEATIENKIEAIRWYFAYGENAFLMPINKLVDEVTKHFFDNTDLIQKGISAFKEISYSTQNKILLNVLYAKIDLLIEKYIDERCLYIRGLDDIESALIDLEKYKKNPSAKIKIKNLTKSRNVLLIKEAKTIEKALDLFSNSTNFCFENNEINLLLEFIISSYLNGTNGASINFDKAMKYKSLYKGQANFVDTLIITKIDSFIAKNLLDDASLYSSNLISDTLKAHYEKLIADKHNENNFNKKSELASRGDEKAMLEVAGMFECGNGTERNLVSAFNFYAEIFKKNQNIIALEGAARCCQSYHGGASLNMKDLFVIAEKKNLTLSSSLQEIKKRFLFLL